VPQEQVESWCNRLAAEILVPLDVLRDELRSRADLPDEMRRLARRFKVSTLVVLRRIHDAGGLTRARMWELYEAELARLGDVSTSSGGNFYLTLPVRVSRRFARALVTNTLEGRTLYRDALRLLGFAKLQTFDELALTLGVPG
jgi:Zn-dependent peptidase ImmA (M78 family)